MFASLGFLDQNSVPSSDIVLRKEPYRTTARQKNTDKGARDQAYERNRGAALGPREFDLANVVHVEVQLTVDFVGDLQQTHVRSSNKHTIKI